MDERRNTSRRPRIRRRSRSNRRDRGQRRERNDGAEGEEPEPERGERQPPSRRHAGSLKHGDSPPTGGPGRSSVRSFESLARVVDDATDLASQIAPVHDPIDEAGVAARTPRSGIHPEADPDGSCCESPSGTGESDEGVRARRGSRRPSIAKLAVTPPVVGSASTEMNRPPASSKRASTAEVFAICIRE